MNEASRKIRQSDELVLKSTGRMNPQRMVMDRAGRLHPVFLIPSPKSRSSVEREIASNENYDERAIDRPFNSSAGVTKRTKFFENMTRAHSFRPGSWTFFRIVPRVPVGIEARRPALCG